MKMHARSTDRHDDDDVKNRGQTNVTTRGWLCLKPTTNSSSGGPAWQPRRRFLRMEHVHVLLDRERRGGHDRRLRRLPRAGLPK